jgi:hypothetical protein
MWRIIRKMVLYVKEYLTAKIYRIPAMTALGMCEVSASDTDNSNSRTAKRKLELYYPFIHPFAIH